MKQKQDLIKSEEIAISAISFLASDVDQLFRFITLTGIDPNSLRAFAQDPEFLIAVLDYFLHDEPLLVTFCARLSINPHYVLIAHEKLATKMEN